MGSGESTTRKVSFGLDEDDTVRILRGVKLSEDVLQRMRNSNRPAEPQTPVSSKESPGPQTQTHTPAPPPGPQPGPPSGHTAADTREELKNRFEKQQAIIKEELARIARQEREASRQDLSRAVQRERALTRQEVDRANQLAKRLEKKEAELKALEAFYKEQIAQLEKKSWERYRESSDQFHAAAARGEASIRSQNMDPVCASLQAQILHCYREHRAETLHCSDLAKEYMHCINATKKNLLVNHG
ncbi:MICOS complex subunit mic25a [Chanos chanos]|uniref:MICOS complex subunit mic25a n=1 Tax=Chanos chanos TaxID=29144 RepID=A0A6J2UXU2_CHACN|nr:MICOS complex subunit mic25a-like [Chanos chanos]